MAEQDEKPKENEKATSSNVAEVTLKGDVKIFPGKPLPHLDRGTAKAYEAETKSGGKGYALICPDNLVPRLSIVHKYMNAMSSSLQKISASGVVEWTPEKKEKYVFIYDGHPGKPLSALKETRSLGLKLDLVLNSIFLNLVDAIAALHDRGVAHGNICLENIFDGGSKNFENVQLGECLSVPSGFAQPSLYETVERSLANAYVKGEATSADDIYALGVALALMIAPHDFADGMSREEIILHKLEHGTFNLITSRDRFPGQIIEVLRGLLSDDLATRWTIWDIKEWLDGRRVSAKQGSRPVPKSTRPIEFKKKKYFRPDVLAMQLHKDPAATVEMVESGELYLWLNRAIQVKEYEERFENAVELAKRNSSGSNYAERLVCYVTMALAPSFPIYYKGHIFFPEHFGHMLVDSIVTEKDLNVFVEIIQGEIVPHWASGRYNAGFPLGEEPGKFESCRMYLLQKSAGFGLERCAYFLSPSARCLSDKLKQYYVRSSKDLIIALNSIGSEKSKPSWFFDRHIVAYLFMHDRQAIEAFSSDLMSDERHRQISAAVKIFSKIQQREKVPALPNLSLWIGEHLDVLINRYHDRERRRATKADVERVKGKGDLTLLAEIFNNAKQIQDDTKMFAIAMDQFQRLRNEHARLSRELETNKAYGKGTGQQISTMVSGGIAGLVILIYLFFMVAV